MAFVSYGCVYHAFRADRVAASGAGYVGLDAVSGADCCVFGCHRFGADVVPTLITIYVREVWTVSTAGGSAVYPFLTVCDVAVEDDSV